MDEKKREEIDARLEQIFAALKGTVFPEDVYIAGVRDGIRMYAHWEDGTQYVGTTGKPLKEALAEWETENNDT